MTKTTKTVVSVAILGVGGYLLYKNFKKPAPAAAFTGMPKDRKKNLAGVGSRKKFYTGVVGKRQRGLTDQFQDIHSTSWGATGKAGANGTQFFRVNSPF